jgi:hypothetical protein
VVAGHPEHLVAALAQPVEKLAGFAELLGSRALREIAADDEQVRLELVDLALDRRDDLIVMRAEMQIGQVDEPRHCT